MKLNLHIAFIVVYCVAFSYQQSCSQQSNSDIALDNLAVKGGERLENCCKICSDTQGCQGYAWNDFNGGTCWLKAGKSPIISKPGVTVGILGGSSSSSGGGGSGTPGGGGSGTPEAGKCWWSGCQPSSWAQRGCFPSDQWRQSNKRPCNNGDEFFCCPAGGSSPNPGPGQTNPQPGGQALMTYNEFSNAVVSNGYPQPSQAVYNAFVQGLPKGSISSKQEAAMALAQFLHESDGLRAKREYRCVDNGCPGDYENPACDVRGQRYFGRGYIQLTWCANYRAASQALFGDTSLVTNPDSVATNENLAWDTAFWFWKVNVHEKDGVSNGSFGVTTKAINGALECSGGFNPVARKRYDMYGKVRAAFGLSGPGIERGCYN